MKLTLAIITLASALLSALSGALGVQTAQAMSVYDGLLDDKTIKSFEIKSPDDSKTYKVDANSWKQLLQTKCPNVYSYYQSTVGTKTNIIRYTSDYDEYFSFQIWDEIKYSFYTTSGGYNALGHDASDGKADYKALCDINLKNDGTWSINSDNVFSPVTDYGWMQINLITDNPSDKYKIFMLNVINPSEIVYPSGYDGKNVDSVNPKTAVSPNVRGTIDKDGNMLIISDPITGYNSDVRNAFNNCSLWETSILVNEGGTSSTSELKWTSGKYKLADGGGTLKPDYKLRTGDVVSIVTKWDSIPIPCADWRDSLSYSPQKSIITISWDGKANLFNGYQTDKDGHCTETDDTITCTVPLTNWKSLTTECVSDVLPYIHVEDCINLYNQLVNNLIFNQVQLNIINANSDCHDLGKLGDWLNLPSNKRHICPAFSEDVRNTVTPFISIVVGLTIIGVVAKWYRGHND